MIGSVVYLIDAACACNIGRVRTNNEDNFYFNGDFLPQDNTGLDGVLAGKFNASEGARFGVFDGMGGEAYGEDASYIAARVWSENTGTPIPELCMMANSEICELAQKRNAGIIGTTVASIVFNGFGATVTNVGDSRIFLCRSGELSQLSQDHTDEKFLTEQGIKRKPHLTQHLGIDPDEMVIEPYVQEIEVREGDIFLLCSDGLTDMVAASEIEEYLSKCIDVEDTVSQLVDIAIENGGKDNITVILCKVELS